MHALHSGAIRGLLTINGQFCGPVDGEGQTFPTARDAEIFIEYMPLTENAKPMALELALEQGKVSRIEPAPHGYALIWPDGLIQLELRPEAPDMPEAGETEQGRAECAAALPDHAAGGGRGRGYAADARGCGGGAARL